MILRHAARVCLVFAFGLIFNNILLGAFVQSVVAQTPTPQAEQESAQQDEMGPSNVGYDPAAVPLPNIAPNTLLGEPLYLENCAPCHGQTGNSDGPVAGDLPNLPPLFSDPETKLLQSPAEYFHTTKFGRIENLMPPWGNRLSDEQIWQAAAYAWSLHTDQESVEAGMAIIDQAAADNPGLRESVESIFGDPSFLFWTQQEIHEELAESVPELAANLSPTDLANVTDYLRTLTIIPPWGALYRAGSATLEGRVVPAVADEQSGNSLANLPITLSAYIQFEPVASFDAVTDDDGGFRFDGLSEQRNVLYLLEATYLDVVYRSEIVDLPSLAEAETNRDDGGGSSAAFIELPVYETTDDPGLLGYNRVNWVVDYSPGEIIVGQILSIGNQGNRTVVGRTIEGVDRPVTLELSLPAGASTIQFQDGVLGGRYVKVGDTIYDTSAIIPGQATHQVFMSYRLPVNGDSIVLEQDFRYPMQVLNLLVAEIPGLEADVPKLPFVGTESVQNIPYRYWRGEDLASQSFAISLTGLIAEGEADPRGNQADVAGDGGGASESRIGIPASARTSPVMEPIIPIMVGSIIFMLLAGIVVWPLSRLRGRAHADRLLQDKERLTKDIALLDDRHEAGKISDDVWQQERSQLKERLLSIARQSQKA